MKAEHVRIGIRPVIDGRWGGIREGLEEQTMGMAVAAKELIESHLRYPDGARWNASSQTAPSAAAKRRRAARRNSAITTSVLPCR